MIMMTTGRIKIFNQSYWSELKYCWNTGSKLFNYACVRIFDASSEKEEVNFNQIVNDNGFGSVGRFMNY